MKPHELIADPKRWCTGTWAKTQDGRHVDWDHPESVSFCMVAATKQCDRSWDDLDTFCLKVFGVEATTVNDEYGHAIAVETLRLCFKDERQR